MSEEHNFDVKKMDKKMDKQQIFLNFDMVLRNSTQGELTYILQSTVWVNLK